MEGDAQVKDPGTPMGYPEFICGNSLDFTSILPPVIGIDIGATSSCVGVMRNGKVEITVSDQGSRITPSSVTFDDKRHLVGEAAKNPYDANLKRIIYNIKSVNSRPSAEF